MGGTSGGEARSRPPTFAGDRPPPPASARRVHAWRLPHARGGHAAKLPSRSEAGLCKAGEATQPFAMLPLSGHCDPGQSIASSCAHARTPATHNSHSQSGPHARPGETQGRRSASTAVPPALIATSSPPQPPLGRPPRSGAAAAAAQPPGGGQEADLRCCGEASQSSMGAPSPLRVGGPAGGGGPVGVGGVTH